MNLKKCPERIIRRFRSIIDLNLVIVVVGYHCYYTRPRAQPKVEC